MDQRNRYVCQRSDTSYDNYFYPDSSLNSEIERLFGVPVYEELKQCRNWCKYEHSLDSSVCSTLSKNSSLSELFGRSYEQSPQYTKLPLPLETSTSYQQISPNLSYGSEHTDFQTTIQHGNKSDQVFKPSFSEVTRSSKQADCVSCDKTKTIPLDVNADVFYPSNDGEVQTSRLKALVLQTSKVGVSQFPNSFAKQRLAANIFQSPEKPATDVCQPANVGASPKFVSTSESLTFAFPSAVKTKNSKCKSCKFCLKNGEPMYVVNSHILKNESGKITCPVLRKYICPYCSATGDEAHTRKYCPKYFSETEDIIMLPPFRRLANGAITTHHNHK